MKKKLLIFIFALAIAAGAFAQQYDPESDFEVKREKDGVVITGYLGSKKEVFIPPAIQDLPVTGIGNNAFAGKTGLTRVTIPTGVTVIGEYAFFGCDGLTGVTIPDSVTTIEGGAFYNCIRLTGVRIPGGVTYIGQFAFLYCAITVITIPDSVKNIGGGAFGGCTKLGAINVAAGNTAYASENGVLYNKSKTYLHTYPAGKTGPSTFSIPATLAEIGPFAFAGCNSIAGVNIPASVKDIGWAAFFNCTRLAAITVAAGNTAYTAENGVLYNKEKTLLHTYPAGKTNASFTIPGSVSNIENYAFAYCSRLTSLTIPDSNTFIGGNAFAQCNMFTSITFQGAIAENRISSSAFPGDLRDKYLAEGEGTYTRRYGTSATWSRVADTKPGEQ
ncbi:MAG: leucine-rich repeat domain-containing protein [Treponema sp.]|nr:leucine-rich repeat domain-containing protein [Treponema sp.]